MPDTLIDLLSFPGQQYLPWLVKATRSSGEQVATLGSDATASIASTPFLNVARGVMVARYIEDRNTDLMSATSAAKSQRYWRASSATKSRRRLLCAPG
jgi:hypothetical protein